MGILKTKNKNKTDKEQLAGAYIPDSVNAYLTLYSVAFGETKSSLLKELITSWKTSQEEKRSEKDLIKKIVQSVKVQWKIEKATYEDSKYEDFIDKLDLELHSKGLIDRYVRDILKQLTDETAK